MNTTGEKYFKLAATVNISRIAKNGFFACPCCANYEITEAGSWEICDTCGWEDDPVQEVDPSMAGGANKVSLSQARENYRSSGYSDPALRPHQSKLP